MAAGRPAQREDVVAIAGENGAACEFAGAGWASRRAGRVFAALALSLLLGLVLVAAAAAQPISGKIVGITDGDTLTLLTPAKTQLKIRLAEIDAPESGQPWGKQSKAMLSDLAFGKQARLVVTDKDRNGRFVARVYVGSLDVNAEMVRRGGAWAFRRYLTDQSFVGLEAAAKRNRLGLWSMPPGQIVAPWDWRANRRSVSDESPAVALAPPSPLTTNLSVGRAVSENPVVLRGFAKLAPDCTFSKAADFLSERADCLWTSAPWRFGAELKTSAISV